MGSSLSKKCSCIQAQRDQNNVINEMCSETSSDIELQPWTVQTTTTAPDASKTSSALPTGIRTVQRSHFLQLKRLIPQRVWTWLGGDEASMTKIEKTIKATLLIQKWYRRYMARLEVRRRYTWTIFQTLEYAGEQDQVKLYNFFNALLQHIPDTVNHEHSSCATSRSSSIETLDLHFEEESPDPDEEYLDIEEKQLLRFTVSFPITEKVVTQLIEVFRKKRLVPEDCVKVTWHLGVCPFASLNFNAHLLWKFQHFHLPPTNVAEILRRSVTALKKMPNLNAASITISKQITVCGDLHGKFDDLLVIFHKNGLPSEENPYVFNGDFVDRGKRGLEVIIVLLCCLLAFPGGVYLNRGNHEDHIMNSRYGFIREVQSKYRRNAEKLLKLIEDVYRYLPLGTIVNNKVLIVHGGISDTTDLDVIRSLDRGKYVSLLRPPMSDSSASSCSDIIDKVEWKQVFDILWSDPQTTDGCIPNQLRGAGTYFGPDVTKKFLVKNRLLYIVRSHECKPDGYEVIHDNLVITIFSASNYYEVGSNNGAYMKIVGTQLDTHYVQYMSNTGKKKLTFYQRMGLVESGAVRELHGQIMSNKYLIEKEFRKADPENTGMISVSQWCQALEKATGLQIPWRMLKDKLVTIDAETQKAKYTTTFDIQNQKLNSVQGASTVVETLYRNKRSLEAIFRIMDKDNSGFISLDEFCEACNLIKEHMPSTMTQEQLVEICRMMDINKDGLVDLNEFLETFRMVDPESRVHNTSDSPELNLQNRVPSPNQTATNDAESHQTVAQPLSPASIKPLNLLPKVKEKENGATANNSAINESSTNESNASQMENCNANKPNHTKSPVLSSRRGSQI